MSSPRDQLHCGRKGCKYTTNRSYNLERHERNHEKGKVPVSQCQPCPHCPYAAGSLHNLMRHIGKKHVLCSPVKKENGKLVSVDKEKEEDEEKKQEQQAEEELPTTSKSAAAAAAAAAAATTTITTEQILKSIINKTSPKREKKTSKHTLLTETSLWDWSTLQQQEKNFLRRFGRDPECKINKQSVNLFKLYTLVRARGGAINVDAWDDVAASFNITARSSGARQVREKYMEVLLDFERNEEERLQECKDFVEVPAWWDDGDFIGVKKDVKPAASKSNNNNHVRSTIVKIIFNKYYKKHMRSSRPFERFDVKDSWLRATMLSSHALISQMHFKPYSLLRFQFLVLFI